MIHRWSGSGRPNFWAWLRDHRARSQAGRRLGEQSMLYRVFDGTARARGRRIQPYRSDDLDLVFRLDGWWLRLIDHPEGTPAWGLMQQALLDIRDTARDMGAQPLILLFLMKEEVYWDAVRGKAPDLADADVARPFNVIREFCRANGIPFCDLRQPLQAEARKGRQLYHRISSHWNDEGNAVAAAAIEQCMREQGIVPRSGGS